MPNSYGAIFALPSMHTWVKEVTDDTILFVERFQAYATLGIVSTHGVQRIQYFIGNFPTFNSSVYSNQINFFSVFFFVLSGIIDTNVIIVIVCCCCRCLDVVVVAFLFFSLFLLLQKFQNAKGRFLLLLDVVIIIIITTTI